MLLQPRPRPLFLTCFIASCVLALLACSPALDWREVRAEGGELIVLLPCKPEKLSRRIAIAGEPTDVTLQACTAQGTTWALTSADVGEPMRVDPALAALRRARTENLAGRETQAQPWQLEGMRPSVQAAQVTVSGQRPDGSAVVEHGWYFARGTRVFHVAALGGTPSAEALETFARGLSFKVESR